MPILYYQHRASGWNVFQEPFFSWFIQPLSVQVKTCLEELLPSASLTCFMYMSKLYLSSFSHQKWIPIHSCGSIQWWHVRAYARYYCHFHLSYKFALVYLANLNKHTFHLLSPKSLWSSRRWHFFLHAWESSWGAYNFSIGWWLINPSNHALPAIPSSALHGCFWLLFSAARYPTRNIFPCQPKTISAIFTQ